MKDVLIIEDEAIAAQNLQRQLAAIDPDIRPCAILQTIEDTVQYLRTQPAPHLIFLDIHLADGSAFAIFQQVQPTCPIIFTTAYDQYALQAFEAGGIDYLLKPIDTDALRRSLQKIQRLTSSFQISKSSNLQILKSPKCPSCIENSPDLRRLLSQQCHPYKRCLLIPAGQQLYPLPVNQIAFIHLGEKISYIYDQQGRQLAYDKPLDAIISELDPHDFFRANRQYIVAHSAVTQISLWPIGKLKLHLTPPPPEPVIVSRARATQFKNWYTSH